VHSKLIRLIGLSADIIEEILSEEIVNETDQYSDNVSKQHAKRITTAAVMRGCVEFLLRVPAKLAALVDIYPSSISSPAFLRLHFVFRSSSPWARADLYFVFIRLGSWSAARDLPLHGRTHIPGALALAQP
jgi:hypothetical protein